MEWTEQVSAKFEDALQVYRVPLFLLTASTFFILLARVFTVTQAAIGVTVAFFVIGSLSLLIAGISAAYSIVRYA
jgi:hypothetical protein